MGGVLGLDVHPNGFLKLMRSVEAEALALNDPNAFAILSIAALRARRTPCRVTGLQIGEAMIGHSDFSGMSRMSYRTATRRLVGAGFVTSKVTSKGTILTLCDSSIYDINSLEDNQPDNQQVTIKQPASNQQVTTNKKERREEGEESPPKHPPSPAESGSEMDAGSKQASGSTNQSPPDLNQEVPPRRRAKKSRGAKYSEAFEEFWGMYPRKKSKGAAADAYAKVIADGVSHEEILAAIPKYIAETEAENKHRAADNKREFCHPATFLNQDRWLDEYNEPKEEQSALQMRIMENRA